MYSLRYGTLPIVRRVGGLKDSIIQFDEKLETGNGFIFDDPDSDALSDEVELAVSVFYNNPRRFKKMMNNAMKQRFTWKTAAEEYVALYRKTLN